MHNDSQQILRLNQHFYEYYANEFAKTRQSYWPGWNMLLPIICEYKPIKIMDAGCGNGRFYKFLLENLTYEFNYLGIDNSQKLINLAKSDNPNGQFIVKDILANGDFTGTFDLITIFGVIHHLPDLQTIEQLVNKSTKALNKKGLLILTVWQKDPQLNKIVEKINDNEYLLNWENKNDIPRYVHVYKETDVQKIINLLELNGLKKLQTFHADGKDGKSNFYLIFIKE